MIYLHGLDILAGDKKTAAKRQLFYKVANR